MSTKCQTTLGPINLCNVIYKIISKIAAHRLEPILTKVISPFQNAFIGGRHIADNYIIAHKILHSFKEKNRKKKDLMGIKLDMSKDI